MTTKKTTALTRVLRSDGFRRVARTFVYAFLGILVPGLLGWLNDLTAWASSQGQTPLPDAHSLAYLGVAAIGAGFVAILNGLGILVENAAGVAPGRPAAKKKAARARKGA